jgi:hypothetical protein
MSLEHPDPASGRPDQTPRDAGRDEADRPSNRRRRIVIASLLAPPAVMTLGVRSAHASPSCAASLNPSHHCV